MAVSSRFTTPPKIDEISFPLLAMTEIHQQGPNVALFTSARTGFYVTGGKHVLGESVSFREDDTEGMRGSKWKVMPIDSTVVITQTKF